jgi:hypothetical protein
MQPGCSGPLLKRKEKITTNVKLCLRAKKKKKKKKKKNQKRTTTLALRNVDEALVKLQTALGTTSQLFLLLLLLDFRRLCNGGELQKRDFFFFFFFFSRGRSNLALHFACTRKTTVYFA